MFSHRKYLFLSISIIFLASVLFPMTGATKARDEIIEVFTSKMDASEIKLVGKTKTPNAKVDVDKMKTILASLYCREMGPVMWKKKIRCFSDKAVTQIAEPFTNTLSLLKSGQKIQFTAKEKSGETRGELFVTSSGMVFKFIRFHGKTHIDEQSTKIDTSPEIPYNWKFVAEEGQAIVVSKRFLGMTQNRQDMVTVLREKPIDIAAESASPGNVAHNPEQVTGPSEDLDALKEKIKFLDELRQENLISEEVYQQKVEELLKGI